MQKFIEVTGKTDEEALAKGLAQLGLDRDDVSLEILNRGKTGFLGIGSVPAKVRLTYEVPDEPEPVREEIVPEPVKPVVEEKHAAPKAPPAEEHRRKPRQERSRAPKPKAELAPAPVVKKEISAPAPEVKKAEPAPAPDDDKVASAIVAFQKGLFARMGVEATPVVTQTDGIYQVTLEGEDLAPLIGRRGETLDAVQQLTGYAVNHGQAHRVRVRVDAEGYRARREETLTRLARKTAGRAVKYRRNEVLEPMNAYERHVIHTALQDYPGVSTHSTGVDPNRRVVIVYDP